MDPRDFFLLLIWCMALVLLLVSLLWIFFPSSRLSSVNTNSSSSLQMLAGLAWNDYQSQIPLASFPVTLLHGDGTRAGAEAETGAGAGAGLPRDRRQQDQEINTSTGASLRSNIQLQLEQGRWNGWLAMMSWDKVARGSSDTASDAPPGTNGGKIAGSHRWEKRGDGSVTSIWWERF